MSNSKAGALSGMTISIASEAGNFGSPDATDARNIDTTTLANATWYSVLALRNGLAGFGKLKQMVYQPEVVTARGGRAAPSVVAVTESSGAVAKSIKGEFTLSFPLRWLGATLPSASALGLLVGSALTYRNRTAGATVACTAVTATTFTVGGGDVASFKAGDMIMVPVAGKPRFSRVVYVDVGALTVYTMTQHGGTSSFTARLCHVYYPAATNTPSGNSFAVYVQDAAAKMDILATGVRITSIDVTRTADAEPEIAFGCTCADGYWTDGASTALTAYSAPLPWGVAGTIEAKVRNAPVDISSDFTTGSAPYEGTRSELPCRDWSFKAAIKMDARGGGQGKRSGIAEWDVVQIDASANVTMDAPSFGGYSPRRHLQLSEVRSLTIPIGGDLADGSCGCMHIAQADVSEDPGRDISDERQSMSASYRAGQYAGDSGASAQTNAPWCIALVA